MGKFVIYIVSDKFYFNFQLPVHFQFRIEQVSTLFSRKKKIKVQQQQYNISVRFAIFSQVDTGLGPLDTAPWLLCSSWNTPFGNKQANT